MRLLIVEDDHELREALTALLQQSGYEVDAHADGRVAFNSLMTKEYDLAIVDLMVPGMSGLALVRSMRKQLSELPILIVTARDGRITLSGAVNYNEQIPLAVDAARKVEGVIDVDNRIRATGASL